MPVNKAPSKCGILSAFCEFETSLKLFENSEGALEKLFNDKTKGDIMRMKHRVERLEKDMKFIKKQLYCQHSGERIFSKWAGFFSFVMEEKCADCEMVLRNFETTEELLKAEIAYNKERFSKKQKQLAKELKELEANDV